MNVAERTVRLVQAALKSYGPSSVKRFLWNREYSGEKWNFAQNSSSDCVYAPLEKYTAGGSILDLGCGSGNTGNEISAKAYSRYVGVDISETCLEKARKRSELNGRGQKNEFGAGDFLAYEATGHFDVILFRESMYHVPIGKIVSTVDYYARFLSARGVFIVRMATTTPDGSPASRPIAMMELLRKEFEVIEDIHDRQSGGTVLVFRLNRRGAN